MMVLITKPKIQRLNSIIYPDFISVIDAVF